MSRPRPVEPLPGDPLGKRLCQMFSYPWNAIVKTNSPDSNWRTITSYPLRPRELWRLWQDAAQIVGVRFDSVTSYGMIDLDVRGAYHPNQDAQALLLIRAALETIGITRTFLTQSSSSGGLHLWLPLSEAVSTFGLAAAIRQCLEAQGLIVEQGQLEIFPNCKAYAREGEFTEYQGHRLPLQPATGAQLLNDDLNPILGGLERFFEIWDQCVIGQDTGQLQQAIAQSQKRWKKRSLRRESSVVAAWRTALELEIAEGWTDYGQTNHLLKQIACYGVVFQGLQGEKLIEYVQRTAVNSPGYSQWCRHQHEIALRCKVWARAAEGYYWPLGTAGKRQGNIHREEGFDEVVPLNRANQVRAEDAQSRITNAFNQLKEAGQLVLYKTKTALENAIIKLAQCSKQTTRKYIHLWYSQENSAPDRVCTIDVATASSVATPTSIAPQKSLKSSSGKEVHTKSYMKGLGLSFEFGSDSSQISSPLGGPGGLSTASQNDTSQNSLLRDSVSEASNLVPDGETKALPQLSQSATPCPKQRRSKSSSSVQRAVRASASHVSSRHNDLRYEFGRLVNQMGWSLEQVKGFIGQVLGKTLQALDEDDWVLLLYRIRNLIV